MGSPHLGTGTIREDFQLSGRVPVERDMLKIAEIMGEIEEAVSLSMRGDILSREQIKLCCRIFFPQCTKIHLDEEKTAEEGCLQL